MSIIISLFTLFLFTASANTQPGSLKACGEDIKNFCSNIPPGEGRLADCLDKNKDKLSALCKETRVKMKGDAEEVIAACKEDYQRFCSHIEPGQGRVLKCFKEHGKELTKACKKELKKKKVRRGEEDVIQDTDAS